MYQVLKVIIGIGFINMTLNANKPSDDVFKTIVNPPSPLFFNWFAKPIDDAKGAE